jgi:tRNA(Glu) U13 pseudouridine synthase TruD
MKDGTVSFSLSRGSFATIVLREIIKPENPLTSGF